MKTTPKIKLFRLTQRSLCDNLIKLCGRLRKLDIEAFEISPVCDWTMGTALDQSRSYVLRWLNFRSSEFSSSTLIRFIHLSVEFCVANILENLSQTTKCVLHYVGTWNINPLDFCPSLILFSTMFLAFYQPFQKGDLRTDARGRMLQGAGNIRPGRS